MINYIKRFLVLSLTLTLSILFVSCNNTNNELKNESLIQDEDEEEIDKATRYQILTNKVDNVCESMIEDLKLDAIYYAASELVKTELIYCKDGSKFKNGKNITDEEIINMIKRNTTKLDELYSKTN